MISCNRNHYYHRLLIVLCLGYHHVCHRFQAVVDASDALSHVLKRMLELAAVVTARVIAWFEQR